MANPLDTVLLPPKLLVRALDDLHRLAVSAELAMEKLDKLDRRADQILELGGRLDERAEEIVELGRRMGNLGEDIRAQGEVIQRRADAVAKTGKEIVDALPTLERAVSLVSPLEGAVERMGRMVDRFPGAPAPRERDRERVEEIADADVVEEDEPGPVA